MRKFILNFTPTGMIPTKIMTPHVPIDRNEIVEDVCKAYDLGITMVHLHARDLVDGKPTYKSWIYGRIIEGIRKHAPDLIICVSLSGRTFKEFKERSAPLTLVDSLKPDMGSLTLSSLNFNKTASLNSPDMIIMLAEEMKRRGIKPELEVFDLGMLNYAKYLIKKRLIEPPYYINLILGNIACAQTNPMTLGHLLSELPPDSYWSVGGVGADQLKANAMGLICGGGVRVGLEDNIWYDEERTRKATNLDLIERIHNIASALELEVMKPNEARELLKL